MGTDVYFIPRDSQDKIDVIFGEDPLSIFQKQYQVEMYIENVKDFEGDKDFLSKFGLELRDNMTLRVAKNSFERVVPKTIRNRPLEGDLIWIPTFHRLFEITFVEHEAEFHSLGKLSPYTYQLKLEQFKYSNEPIKTGIKEIDSAVSRKSYGYNLILYTDPNVGGYIGVGEQIYEGGSSWETAIGTATVSYVDITNCSLHITNIAGRFVAGDRDTIFLEDEENANTNIDLIQRETSDYFYQESDIIITSRLTNNTKSVIHMSMFSEDDISDNKIIENESNTIIIGIESDPLGGFTS